MAAAMPWLSLLVLLPLAGALLVLFCSGEGAARRLSLGVALAELLVALVVLMNFDASGSDGFQLVEEHAWIAGLNVYYRLGIDGLSVLFLPVTALLGVMAILASWHQGQRLPGFYFAMLLALLGTIMGVFLALDTILFFLFWELTLPPLYFLISLWGCGPGRRLAAMKYIMTMMFGGIPLLFAFILLAGSQGGDELVFSLPVLLETAPEASLQPLLLLLLVLGFAPKTPLFPFHTWMPAVAMESPAQLTALLVGLKLGAFGILRLALPLAPAAAADYAWVLGTAGAVTLVYAAFVAIQQSNLRRMLAYASISHVGLVVIGISALNAQGIQGAIFQLLNFSMIAGSLMLICSFLQDRTGSNELVSLGGLAGEMPRMAGLFFLFALASLGLPGTSGFAAEILLVIGALELHYSLGLVALFTMIVGAAYVLTHARKTFWGPPTDAGRQPHADISTRELLVLVPPAVFILVFGLFPGLVIDIIRQSSMDWLAIFNL